MWAAPDETQYALFALGGLTWPVVGTSLVRPRRNAADAAHRARED
jgi:hypothetical protein